MSSIMFDSLSCSIIFGCFGVFLRYFLDYSFFKQSCTSSFFSNSLGTIILAFINSEFMNTTFTNKNIQKGLSDGFCGCLTTYSGWIFAIMTLIKSENRNYGFFLAVFELSFYYVCYNIFNSIKETQQKSVDIDPICETRKSIEMKSISDKIPVNTITDIINKSSNESDKTLKVFPLINIVVLTILFCICGFYFESSLLLSVGFSPVFTFLRIFLSKFKIVEFPIGLLFSNMLGSFIYLFMKHWNYDSIIIKACLTGVLGSLTTMSSYVKALFSSKNNVQTFGILFSTVLTIFVVFITDVLIF
eukprot:TRINITY_DN7249_c0_g1_i1.p1 TRINITY_DN7249_c0_g1~~TRINITY_DN7249_c0_g1_i1.p1  ORF type:complete len:311 (+),score=58.18 TRINITY_DN7249_c0_g1_i1:30-935(+)